MRRTRISYIMASVYCGRRSIGHKLQYSGTRIGAKVLWYSMVNFWWEEKKEEKTETSGERRWTGQGWGRS